ncbi:MAG: hypothetical protein J6Q53_08390 [Oscillospiraceae bacterium]|nr:hypothetical protein [Oscillospiraceae bacterium]
MKLQIPDELHVTLLPGMYVFLALLLLLLPLRWLLALAVSTVVHELFHIGAIRLLGIRLYGMSVEVGSVKLHTEPMTARQELICAIAGPLGGLSLLLLARRFPVTATCAAFQSFYNLLPLEQSDGSRILRCGAKLLLPMPVAERLCGIIERAFLVCILLVGIYGSVVLKLGLVPVGISLVILLKNNKSPCKAGGQAVQ